MKRFRHFIIAIAALAFGGALIRANGAVINNDAFFKDTSGNPIYAQGGGVFRFGGTWYWYGVKYNGAVTYYNNPSAGKNSDTSFNAFTCYSSTNLVDWKFENNVMTSASPGLGTTSWVGRMGVAYNTNTQKYVLLSQYSGSNGSGVMFATCNTPTGNFVYDHLQTSIPIVNTNTGDQTVFLDTDGTAYLICSSASGRSHLYVLPLHPADYLTIDPGDNIYNGNGREGNMMFKYNGWYYFCSSDLHGWNASHCYVIDSTNILGTYSAEYVMNRTDLDFCHVSQTGFGVTAVGTNGTTVLFVGDRWCDFAGNGVGYNQWCPVSFDGTTPTFESVTRFDLNAAAGTWSVVPGNNYILNPGFEADRVSQTNVAGWTSTGSGYGNVSGSHSPGRWHFHHTSTNAYSATTDQVVTGLPVGTYTLSVWYKSSGGQATAQIFARNFGGAEIDANVNTPQASWTQIAITNIVATNGQCNVGLYSVAGPNQSVDVDDWSLTLAGPPPPVGLTAASGNTQVVLNWNAAPDATGYNVKRSTVSGGPYTTIASPATNTYTDTSVLNGTTYYYVVSATNSTGESTNSTEVSVYVLSLFQQWQMNYFGCTNCPQAAPDADPLGKGMSNTNQFLAGLDPTNSASALRIISVVQQSNDVVITWTTAGVRTNAVQATVGDANGGYTNNFNDISGSITIPVSGDATTNYLDAGGATNAPSRYYRIRLVP